MIAPIDVAEVVALLNATRARYGLKSDKALAGILGVSRQAIYRWRRGEIDLSARILAALVREESAKPTTSTSILRRRSKRGGGHE